MIQKYIDYLWILNQIENNEMLEYLNNDENTQLNATYMNLQLSSNNHLSNEFFKICYYDTIKCTFSNNIYNINKIKV